MAGKEKVHLSGALENRMRYAFMTIANRKLCACFMPKRLIT